jgi:hypothetical protein
MSDSNNSTDTSPDDDNPMSDRGWYTENSWIITPLIVLVLIGLACVALHTYRSRRLRRRAALVREEGGPTTSTWAGRRRQQQQQRSGSRSRSRGGAERDPELGFTPASGTLIAQIEDRWSNGSSIRDNGHGADNRSGRNGGDSISSPQAAHTTAGAPGRRWQNAWTGRWGGPTNRAPDDGLDEFGEAPPPYESKKRYDGSGRAVVGRDVVELARMRAEAEAMAGERPPEYGVVVSSGAVQERRESEEGEGVARPERTERS